MEKRKSEEECKQYGKVGGEHQEYYVTRSCQQAVTERMEKKMEERGTSGERQRAKESGRS